MRDVLEDKHLETKPTHAETIATLVDERDFHPLIFESITTKKKMCPSNWRSSWSIRSWCYELETLLHSFWGKMEWSLLCPSKMCKEIMYILCRSRWHRGLQGMPSYSAKQISWCAINRKRGSGSKNHQKSHHEINETASTSSYRLSITLCRSGCRMWSCGSCHAMPCQVSFRKNIPKQWYLLTPLTIT